MTDLGAEDVPETEPAKRKRKPRAKKAAAPPPEPKKAAPPKAPPTKRPPSARGSAKAGEIQISGNAVLIGAGNAKLDAKFARNRAAQDKAGIRRIDLDGAKGGRIEFDSAAAAGAFFDSCFNGDLNGIDEDDYTWMDVPFDGKL